MISQSIIIIRNYIKFNKIIPKYTKIWVILLIELHIDFFKRDL